MALVEIETLIHAPVERVFDLSCSIDAHMASTDGTGERAVAGRTEGLIRLDETVTWEATHLFVRQRLTSKITEYERPNMFVDEMIRGAFASIHHRHCFTPHGTSTLMKDEFKFSAPMGFLGTIVEQLFLTRYMTRFLELRNQGLKRMAETEEWRRFLPS